MKKIVWILIMAHFIFVGIVLKAMDIPESILIIFFGVCGYCVILFFNDDMKFTGIKGDKKEGMKK